MQAEPVAERPADPAMAKALLVRQQLDQAAI
jgi:hypothetical protein